MGGQQEGGDDWKSWSKHILAELKRLSDGQEKMGDKMQIISNDIVMLKIKATIWGAVGASVPILLFVAVQIIVYLASSGS